MPFLESNHQDLIELASPAGALSKLFGLQLQNIIHLEFGVCPFRRGGVFLLCARGRPVLQPHHCLNSLLRGVWPAHPALRLAGDAQPRLG